MEAVEKRQGIETAGETERARRASGVFPAAAAPTAPGVAPTEVEPRAHRRSFTAEYKRRILREADRCTRPGELGALVRREGLYFSHIRHWRAARARGELAALSPKKRGPKPVPPDLRDKKIAEQEREIARLSKRAERAEALVELQKKVAALLGTPFENEKS
jgi:transposase